MSTFEPLAAFALPTHTAPVIDEVVTRWVALPARTVERALRNVADGSFGEQVALGFGDELRLDGAFARSSDGELPTWRVPGRLVWHGPKLARTAHVEIALTAWSDDAVEVSVRPAGRRVLAWGARRERRYFDTAHRAATRIAQAVAA